ncbi:MAG: nucleotidyltransferase domain-containing protein [Planctomycetes bacterium]|nr:nucleotidyltransferase domain-containing protein [Planctomycetota bacterium]
MDRAELLQTLGDYFRTRPEVLAAWLFGSQARATARADSDVDVAILLQGGAPRSVPEYGLLTDIQADLEAVLRRDVDVVVCNGAAPDLLHRVLRDGVLVHESDHERRILFEVAARNEYWDLLPILDLYRRKLLEGA